MANLSKDLPNLDFIRSLAVLFVAWSHTMLYMGHAGHGTRWTGITGVAIFFVHTSLVLMWSIERDPHAGRFYVRRIFRIYPLWLVVLFLTIAIHLPMSPLYAPGFGFYMPTKKELLANVLLIFNLCFGTRVVGASWTLPIEVDMYLFLPLLFAFAIKFKTVWTLLVIDLFFMLYAREQLPPINSSLPMCVPWFLPGVMAFMLMKRQSLQRLPGWSFIVWIFFICTIDHFFGSWRNSSIFCLALGLSLPLFRQVTWVPLKKVSSELAKYSYGIYLSHIAVIDLAVHVLRNEPTYLRVAAYAVAFCVLPVIFYHLVERPMIRVGARIASHIESGPTPRMDDNALRLEPAP